MSTSLNNPEEFFRAYSETGQFVMMLQEEVMFDMYFRCYCIDQRNVKVMNYEPRNPYHLRYVRPIGRRRSRSSRRSSRACFSSINISATT